MGNKKYKAKHKELGLCRDCSAPALPGKTRCEKHHVSHRLGDIKSKKGGLSDYDLFVSLSKQNEILQEELRRERIKTQQVVEACLAGIAKLKIKPVKPPKPTKKKEHELEAHILRSDCQIGEVVDPQSTSGLGEYSFDIYLQRLDTLTEKVILFHEQDRGSLGLRKLIIPYLGDIVGGESIYRGQSFHIDRPLVDQLFEGVEAEVSRFILPLAERFENIEIYTVIGNHGRAGDKGATHTRTNWDYVFYRCLQNILATAAPHVKVFVSESPMMLVEHGEFLFCYRHGDEIKSWMGIPYYGLDRMTKRTTNMFNKPIAYTCCGHFHNPANINDSIIINGTMMGGNDLSINKMNLTTVPSQKMFYFHGRYGINRESNLYLADPVVLDADEFGILTPYTATV